MVIGTLATQLLSGVQESPDISAAVKEQATVQLESGVQFVSDAQLADALATTTLTPTEQQAIVDANATARVEALQEGMVAVALISLLGLFLTTRLPDEPLVTDEPAAADETTPA